MENFSSSTAGLLQLEAASVHVAVTSPGNDAVQLLGGGAATPNAADTHPTVTLLQASALTLSQQRFITAIGSSGNDPLAALVAGQQLTGGQGVDTLIGTSTMLKEGMLKHASLVMKMQNLGSRKFS